MTIKEMAHAVHLGASLETIAPADADIPYLRRIVNRYIDKYITGTAKRKRRKHTRRSGRPRTSSNYAAQVVVRYQATAELVERVNSRGRQPEPDGDHIPFEGEPCIGPDRYGLEARG